MKGLTEFYVSLKKNWRSIPTTFCELRICVVFSVMHQVDIWYSFEWNIITGLNSVKNYLLNDHKVIIFFILFFLNFFFIEPYSTIYHQQQWKQCNKSQIQKINTSIMKSTRREKIGRKQSSYRPISPPPGWDKFSRRKFIV